MERVLLGSSLRGLWSVWDESLRPNEAGGVGGLDELLDTGVRSKVLRGIGRSSGEDSAIIVEDAKIKQVKSEVCLSKQ